MAMAKKTLDEDSNFLVSIREKTSKIVKRLEVVYSNVALGKPPFMSGRPITSVASVFWNIQGVILVDHLPKGQTINSDYFINFVIEVAPCYYRKSAWKVNKEDFVSHGLCKPAYFAQINSENSRIRL